MRMRQSTRVWLTNLAIDESEFRQQISTAIAAHRKSHQAKAFSYTAQPRLRASLVTLGERENSDDLCQIEVLDFDERGITFQHARPLHERRALVVFEGPNLGRIAAEVDLSWCRFSQSGEYTSGGRFVRPLALTA